MKKLLIIIGVILIALAALTYFTVPRLIVAMVTDYDPYTFEQVLETDSLKEKYGIGENRDPSGYGYDNFQEITYPSLMDSTRLSAWFIPAADTIKQCLLLIHGRTSNRLKPMKYLAIMKASGLDSMYHILIPDLRNSGKSEPAKTYMGYKFAEDIASWILWAKNNSGADEFTLFGWSMGAMASMSLMGRDDLHGELDDNNVTVERIILGCPLSNVWTTLHYNGQQLGVPDFFFKRAYNLFERETNNFAYRMKLRDLCATTDAPIMIIASKTDKTTPFFILEEELAALGNRPNLETHFVDSAEHVQIYQTESYHDQYVEWVTNFLSEDDQPPLTLN